MINRATDDFGVGSSCEVVYSIIFVMRGGVWSELRTEVWDELMTLRWGIFIS
jgi:hypothetical protein